MHDCIKEFTKDSDAVSDTKYVENGHCTVCMRRMLRVFRYQGTYDREGMTKLDPKRVKS